MATLTAPSTIPAHAKTAFLKGKEVCITIEKSALFVYNVKMFNMDGKVINEGRFMSTNTFNPKLDFEISNPIQFVQFDITQENEEAHLMAIIEGPNKIKKFIN